ncbi:protein NDUFAF4 homolog [Periplaneta americana]|uniref:protein NDUFAF4 homolog n=1 Tax=Periplaneta americana TaxID=6978 RepID=UPI0037E81F3A
MGKVLSVMQRKANRFNVENRAHKVISMEKPKPAPRYPSTEQELETLKADYPQFLEQQYKKDSKLDDRLKQVFVRSQDPAIVEESPIDSSRPLPQDRSAVEEPVYGYREPRMVPQGRFTLKQAIKFISDHQENPSTWTAAAIAKQYNINQDKLEKILFYYRTFQVHIPEKVGKKIPKKIEVEASETQSTQKLIQPQEEKLQHQENKGI